MKPLSPTWAWLLLCQLVACSSPSSSSPASGAPTSGAAPAAATLATTSLDPQATAGARPGLRPGANDPGAGQAASAPMEPSLRQALVQARQAEATEAHRIQTAPDGLRAEVPEAHLRGRFDDRGAELTSSQDASVHTRLTLATVGRGAQRQAVEATKPVASAHAVRWERPVGGASVEETWQTGPLGLEHRVLVRQRPAGSGLVELEVTVTGLHAEQDGAQVKLLPEAGGAGLTMREYLVRDASGKLLAGTMSVREGKVVYRYEDAGAVYPVEIDPLVATQQAKLLASDKDSNDSFGASVALSSDGTTALIGAYVEDDATDTSTTSNGAAYVFVRSGASWIQQAKLLASDRASDDFFGISVALSGDGATALIGAFQEDDATGTSTTGNGAAYVFVRSGSTWSQQAKLLAGDKASVDYFGWSVSLSGNGSTALIGAKGADDVTGPFTADTGAAYVFARSGSGWSQQAKLLASDKASGDAFGYAVALSGDGTTALIGAFEEDDATGTDTLDNGAAYVFVRSGSSWAQQAKLLATDKDSRDSFGASVALSGDGATALIGAYGEDDATVTTLNRGAAYVFVRSGSSWSQQTKLLAGDKASDDYFGWSVALSGNGSTALIGAFAEDDATGFSTTENGAAYVFVRSGSGWSQQAKLLAADRASGDAFGYAVSLSGDGATALIGASGEDDATGASTTGNGATYVFTLVRQPGDACSAASECGTGFCVDGVCCNTACGGGTSDCQACSVAAGAAVNGTCGPSTGNTCSDGNACTQTDVCAAGVCTGSNPVACAASDPCHDAGTCDPATGVCSSPNKVDGAACNDGDACTQDDSCQAGACVPGKVLSCDDGNACTSDACDKVTGCQNPPVADATPCDDGNVCNVGDRCVAGACKPTGGLDCDDQNPCTADSCDAQGKCVHAPLTDGSACTDDNGCTVDDACQSGACVAGAGKVCTPPECQQGAACDPGTGQCVFTNVPDGTPCAAGSCVSGSCESGAGGSAGSSGAGGESGAAGEAGQSGAAGAAGESGAGGSTSGQAGEAGQAGGAGQSGSAGQPGTAGTSGSAGTAGNAGTAGQVAGGNGDTAGSGGSGQAGATAAGQSGAAGKATGGAGGVSTVDLVGVDAEVGCDCSTTGRRSESGAVTVGLLVLGLVARRRRAA